MHIFSSRLTRRFSIRAAYPPASSSADAVRTAPIIRIKMLLQIIYSDCLTRAFAEHDELREHAGREQLRRGGTATQVFIFTDMDADEKIHARVHALQDTLRFGEIAYLIADDYLRRKGSECCQNTNILWIACQNIGEADIALRASAARSGYLSALVNYCYAIISAAENFSEPLNIVIGCAVAITVFASSAGVISQGMSAVEATSDFMLALIPVLAGIITAAGNPTLALTYGSFAMAAAQAAAQTAGNIIMPLCGAFSAFGVSASLSPELKLTKLADMIKKLTIGVLSFVAAAFSAVLGLKSLLAGSADTLASKGIKLALSSAVPIVGGALSDAYSSIIGSVSLLKSTVGVFGVIAVVMIDLPVVLQLTARIILLKLLGVLSSSMGDDTTGEVLDTLSSALTVINAAVIFTAALFIISTGIVISVKAGA